MGNKIPSNGVVLGKEEEEEEGDEAGAGQVSCNENILFFLVKKVIDTH